MAGTTSERSAGSDMVTVGMIGTGWADRVQIPALQAAGLEVAMVASSDLERARRVAERHGVRHAVGDWQEIVESDVDLVSVTSPPYLHAEHAVAVLEAGKHLLCEKPLALDVPEAERTAAAAMERSEQLALVDHELRFLPARAKARELIASGALGRILLVTARVATGARIDASKPWDWWSDARRGGGMLNAIGSHVIDGVRWLLDAEVRMQGATLGRVVPRRADSAGVERDVTSDDIASATFSAGGAVGTMVIHAAALDDALDLLTIRGTQGTLVLDRSLKLYFGKRGGTLKEFRTQPLSALVPNRFRASPYAAGTVLLGDALRRHLAEGERGALTQAATVADGLAVQRALAEARSAAELL